jgi:hypothetical protein
MPNDVASVRKGDQAMLVMLYALVFFVALAYGALRWGADSRRDINARQLDWTVRA